MLAEMRESELNVQEIGIEFAGEEVMKCTRIGILATLQPSSTRAFLKLRRENLFSCRKRKAKKMIALAQIRALQNPIPHYRSFFLTLANNANRLLTTSNSNLESSLTY